MSPDTELAATLERALDDLPSVPATAYLLEGKRVRRRRRVVTGLVVGVEPRGSNEWYLPYSGTSYPDFASFLEMLRSGS